MFWPIPAPDRLEDALGKLIKHNRTVVHFGEQQSALEVWQQRLPTSRYRGGGIQSRPGRRSTSSTALFKNTTYYHDLERVYQQLNRPQENRWATAAYQNTGLNILFYAALWGDRIKELLRIFDFLASPFGSQEDLLLQYGIKDVDYTLDESGKLTLNDRTIRTPTMSTGSTLSSICR